MFITTIFLFTLNWPCIWPLLLAAILPFILGCLFCRSRDNRDRERELEKENERLRAALAAAESRGDSSERQVAMGAATTSTPTGYNALFTSDNLEVIEGIGPKVSALLKTNGYTNWSKLSKADADDLKKIMADSKLSMLDPTSWPQQAMLADQGRWTELIEYQKFLDGGREDTGNFDSDSKVELLALKMYGFKNDPKNLKIVEGIGPKIEKLLKEAGIESWSNLAAASEIRLQGILDNAKGDFKLAQPGTWPRQAELALQGKWDELKEYQDFLQGGRDPS